MSTSDFACALAFAAMVAAAIAVPAYAYTDSEAIELRDRVLNAYANTDTYQAEVVFEATQKDGRWRLIQKFKIAFDRSGNKLLIDTPDVLVVCDGNRLYMRSDRIFPGRHLDVTAPEPLQYESLLDQVPFMRHPPMPDVMMLLGADPTAFASNLRRLGPASDDFSGRPRLRFDGRNGQIAYRIDPDRYLITGVRWRTSSQVVGPLRPEPTELSLDINIVKRNSQFDEELFAFDTSNSQAVHTLHDPSDVPGPRGEQLEGERAPSIDVDQLDGRAFILRNVDEKVVVLDFWATWSMACHKSLATMQKLHEWAEAEGKSVRIVAVNLREKPEDVRRFWQWKEFTLPTLLDPGGKVAEAYRVEGVPQTVFIRDGKVADLVVGYHPNADREYRRRIEQLLAD